jgi:peptidyl-dipeptidase Dcp
MPAQFLRVLTVAVAVSAAACIEPSMMAPDTGTTTDTDNALLADWTGPFGGIPAFDKMDLDALKPALEAGMARQLDEIDVIVSSPDAPSFENTIVALERAGRDMNRVSTYLGV